MPALPRLRSHPIQKAWLLETYLFGLDLTDDKGNPYPDSMWEEAGSTAIEWLETNLDVVVIDRQRDLVERQDYEVNAWEQWQWVQLDRAPIRRVSKVEYVYGGDRDPTKVVEVPLPWVRVSDEDAGQVQIIPNTGTMGAAFAQLFGGSLVWLNVATAGARARIPGFYRVTYRAGWYGGYYAPGLPTAELTHVPPAGVEINGPIVVKLSAASGQAGTAVVVMGTDAVTGLPATETLTFGAARVKLETEREWSALTSVELSVPGSAETWAVECPHAIPRDVLHLGGMYATMWALNPAGDMIAGAGIASKSIGVDGLSQSISTTASATNAGYGSRLIQYWNDIKRQLPALRAKYRQGSMIEVA